MIRKLLQKRLGRRGSFALEFAMVAPIFLVLLFAVFEVSYDEFMQEVLDNSLQIVARDIQIGETQGATSAPNFMSTYFCPAETSGLLNCGNIYLRVEAMNFSTGTCSNLDFYNATSGTLPITGRALQLGNFWSVNGQGNGSALNLSPCATTNSDNGTDPGYCNPASATLVLLTAVYVAPSFLQGLLNPVTYNGRFVRPILATAAFATEPFIPVANQPLQC